MARQVILGGFPNPIFINETHVYDAIQPSIFVDESSAVHYNDSFNETCSATDTITAKVNYAIHQTEAGSATDTITVIAQYHVTQDDEGNATDTITVIGIYNVSQDDEGNATDTITVTLEGAVSQDDEGNATDTITVIAVYNVSIDEEANAQDHLGTPPSGGGGGGAAGPFGLGEDGGNGNVDGTGGYGGAGDDSLTPRQYTSGATGNTGSEFGDGVTGSGSGGAGGAYIPGGNGQAGGIGGTYGGGGAGGGGTDAPSLLGGAGGIGGDGVIWISYTSTSTGLTKFIILTKSSTSPFIFPSDWSNTNQIVLIGQGGCGSAGTYLTGGNGGGGGDALIATNVNIYNPGDSYAFFIPTTPCSREGTKLYNSGGYIVAASGKNGDGTFSNDTTGIVGTFGTGGGGSGTITIMTGGNGGPGGHYTTIVYNPATKLASTPYGLFFWNYIAWYGKVDKLACWIAGLDCGDWPINPDGSVFVPWQSDPDKLFTRDWLQNVSDNPPEGGFGASACTIDLGNPDGTITRVIVDTAIGIPYCSQAQILRPHALEWHGTFPTSTASTRRIHQYGLQVTNTQGLQVGTTVDKLEPAVFRQKGGNKYPMSTLYTGIHWDLLEDDYGYDSMFIVEVCRPYPAKIDALNVFFRVQKRDGEDQK